MPLDRECFLLVGVPALVRLLVLRSLSSSLSSVRLAALALLQDVVFVLPERNCVVYITPVLHSA
jgi:hypothetical protein